MEKTVSPLLLPQSLFYRATEIIVLLFICLASAQAQPASSSTSRDVVRSVLPDFPAGTSGKTTEVSVNITIGEQGQIGLAETIGNKSTLGDSCVAAARQWQFTREIPARTTGILKFSFTPDGKVNAAALFSLKVDWEDPVPKPLFQSTEGEATWWENLRTAGREVVIAHKVRNIALQNVYDRINKEIDRRTDGLSDRDSIAISGAVYRKYQPEINAVHREHNPKVSEAEDRYRALLREANQKALIEPLPSHRPIVVQMVKAKYTEEARQNKVQGTVMLNVEMGAGGTITGIRIVRSLPDGLTEKAIEAATQLVFIPESRNGKFVASRVNLEFSFNLY